YSMYCVRASFFFFNNTATPEIYTLSLHDALPISGRRLRAREGGPAGRRRRAPAAGERAALVVRQGDTRLREGGARHRSEGRRADRAPGPQAAARDAAQTVAARPREPRRRTASGLGRRGRRRAPGHAVRPRAAARAGRLRKREPARQ